MTPTKNLPMLMNLVYYGFNRGLPNGDFAPQFGADGSVQITHCNEFIQYVCNGLGYTKFSGMLANEMIDFMANYVNGWIIVSDEIAQSHANSGVLVIAGHRKDNGHGHVCLIIPGVLEKSPTWAKSVPKCVNIGREVFIGKRVSSAFQQSEMPVYFALADMVS